VLYQNSRKCTCALESWKFLTRIRFSNIKLLHKTAESIRFLDVMVTFCGWKMVGQPARDIAYPQTRPRPSSHATFCHFLTRIELYDIELLHRTTESTRFLLFRCTFCGSKWVGLASLRVRSQTRPRPCGGARHCLICATIQDKMGRCLQPFGNNWNRSVRRSYVRLRRFPSWRLVVPPHRINWEGACSCSKSIG
jgi:hypothetical protein